MSDNLDFQVYNEFVLMQWNVEYSVLYLFFSPGSWELLFIPMGTSVALEPTEVGILNALNLKKICVQ